MHISVFEKRLTIFDRSLSVRSVIRADRQEYQILQEVEDQVMNKGVVRNRKGKVHVCYTQYLTDRVFEILRRCKMTRFRKPEDFLKEFKLPAS